MTLLPVDEPKAETALARVVLPLARAHAGMSGVLALRDGHDAFAARALLADQAERTLDVQYYIWHDDLSGNLLLDALRRAADRGVRVRLLLDDNNTAGLDALLATLNAYPNIEVRLFNPVRHRRWRFLDYLTDFARLNHRMHNKSFTADNQVTIVGGRNVGDEYFDAGRGVMFIDLDVMAIGPVASEVAADFERYWSCHLAVPVDQLIPAVHGTGNAAAAAGGRSEPNPAELRYTEAVKSCTFIRDLLATRLQFEWAKTTLVSDDPAKVLDRVADGDLLWSRLKLLIGAPSSTLHIISAYFVPGGPGTDDLVALARQGVRIAVLTNSLEATDVWVVHAGYAKRRRALLRAGVTLFEMKRDPGAAIRTRTRRGTPGSSSASLHAKTAAVDGVRAFVGSFNFDLRSAQLNTELGFVIQSPVMASTIVGGFEDEIPARAYQVRLTDTGALEWLELKDGNQIRHRREPGSAPWTRLGVRALSLLPIDWLL